MLNCDQGGVLALTGNQFGRLFTVAVNWTGLDFFVCGMYLCERIYGQHPSVVLTPSYLPVVLG